MASTINTSDVSRIFNASWVDTTGTTHTGVAPGYGNPTWSADDGGELVSLQTLTNAVKVSIIGPTGTFNLTATSTKSGSETITGTEQVTIEGPVPASLSISLQPLS